MDSSTHQPRQETTELVPIPSASSIPAPVNPESQPAQNPPPLTKSIPPLLKTLPVADAAAVSDPVQPGIVLDGYLILETIGRGGMGIVFKARQSETDRLVALKMIRDGSFADQDARDRFVREIQALGRMQPVKNIVPIHHVGHHDGQPFFVMPYLTGGCLKQNLQRFQSDRRKAVVLMEKIARAVQQLHNEQMLHRDIKPGNILLDADDEPYLSDFGVIKLLDSDDSLTQPDALLGTAPYMAPEQTQHNLQQIGPHTDIWALGILLYELLTGLRPFRGDSNQDSSSLAWKIVNQAPPPPRQLNPDLDAGLEAVVLKCLEKQPAHRFGSAEELADELARWLQDEPVHTRANRGWRRLLRVARRYSKALAVLAVLLLVASAIAPVVWYVNHPDRPLWQMQKQLTAGQPVTLIGEKSAPAWSNWLHGKPAQTSIDNEGYFNIHALNRVLFELLPEVPCRSYRLRGKIRHDTSEFGGSVGVGIYVGHHAKNMEFGNYALYYQVFYDDVINNNLLKKPNARPILNCVQFNPVLHADVNGKEPEHYDFRLLGVCQFQATPFTGRQWRELEITVSPDQILARFEKMPIFPININEETARLRRDLEDRATKYKPAFGPLRICDTYFNHQGSLGIVISHGSAALSNFVLEPLPVEGAR